MDAGLAAVCGALAGSAATIGAAFAAGWWQRENARLTARSEHARQRRDSRQAVYREFIHQVNEICEAHGPGAPRDVDLFGRERAQQIASMYVNLRPHTLAVALAGPDEIADLAEKIDRACATVQMQALLLAMDRESGSGASNDRMEKMGTYLEEAEVCRKDFLRIARKVLDDDGLRAR